MTEDVRAQALADQLIAEEARLVEPSARVVRRSGLIMLFSLLLAGFSLDWQLTHPLMLAMYGFAAAGGAVTPLLRRANRRRIDRIFEQHDRITQLADDVRQLRG